MWTNETRRQFLQNSGFGLGWLAALDLFSRTAMATPAPQEFSNPLASQPSPLPASAKSVIHLFMQGGPSHIDTFDPKPVLNKLDGQHPPASFGNEDFQNGQFRDSIILGSKRTFQKHGQSGMLVSDLFPHVAQRADDLAVIRS